MSITDRLAHARPQEKVLVNASAALRDDKLLTNFPRIRVTGRAMAGGDVRDRRR